MELKSRIAKKYTPVESVSDQVINHFIAQMEQVAPTQITDPTMLQPGQVITDQAGESLTVIENDPMTDNVVLAPSDTAQNVPEGTTTVQETDLATQYSMDSKDY